MTPETRTTILFWCQVGLFVTAMVLILGILALAWYFITAQIRAMDENRDKDRAMLQQHMSLLRDHDRAREQHALAFEALIERLRR